MLEFDTIQIIRVVTYVYLSICVCVCVRMYVYTNTHTCIYVYIYIYIYIYIYVHIYIYTYSTYIHKHIAHTYTHMYAYTHKLTTHVCACSLLQEAWEIDPSEIVVKERLGEGHIGVIHKARWRGLDVALKTLKEGLDLDSGEHHDLQHELEVLTRHRHPNLVMFIGACTTSQPFMIVCEYMSGGNLESLFLAKKGRGGQPWRPPRQQVVAWTADLMRALCFLHGCKPKIVHRDLKPSNLLLSSNRCVCVCVCVCMRV
jgi:hypothetical protein